jgi:hypothetical protein
MGWPDRLVSAWEIGDGAAGCDGLALGLGLGTLAAGGLLGRLVWIGAPADGVERIATTVAAMATTAPAATAMLIGSRLRVGGPAGAGDAVARGRTPGARAMARPLAEAAAAGLALARARPRPLTGTAAAGLALARTPPRPLTGSGGVVSGAVSGAVGVAGPIAPIAPITVIDP